MRTQGQRLTRTPTVILAAVAILIALGGSSYAGARLADNSVGTAQLKDGAVTAAKVRNRSLTRADFAAGQLPHGPRGPRGSRGPAGTALPHAYFDAPLGDEDVNGGAVVNSLTLPAGTWVLLETLNAASDGPDTTSTTRLECTMSSPTNDDLDFAKVRLGPQPNDPSQFVRIDMSGALVTTAPTEVTVTCLSTSNFKLLVMSRHLVALPQTGLN